MQANKNDFIINKTHFKYHSHKSVQFSGFLSETDLSHTDVLALNLIYHV